VLHPLDWYTREERIAYFSMEIALRAEISTYSGGLGVLAGDMLRSAADLDLPMVGVTLVSRNGYFRQTIDAQGRQSESPDPWDPAKFAAPLSAKIELKIEGRPVWVTGWLYEVEGLRGTVPVVLLDTFLPENDPADRRITDVLYGGDDAYRLAQEVVLGIGGVRLLHALGFHIRRFHMNEGHAALLSLELLRASARPDYEIHDGESEYDVPAVRGRCIFTTHTPVDAARDAFGYDLVTRIADGAVPLGLAQRLGGSDKLNMTRLALSTTDYVNGVAERHRQVSQQMYPHYHIHAITNGVHSTTWTSPPFAALFDEAIPWWRHDPEALIRAEMLDASKLLAAHTVAKEALIASIRERTGISLEPALPIIGFARRMTAYKRPLLLFHDLERLRALAKKFPFQVVYAGKAHPNDGSGKGAIEELHAIFNGIRDVVPSAFVPNYDMTFAATLVAGNDVWLNTPLPPLEASGTSGMKAALNGVPTLSIPDGWWFEGRVEGVNGWSFGQSHADATDADGSDARSLYEILESHVLPWMCGIGDGRVAMMRGAISRTGSIFQTHRVMRRYAAEAYLR
jgi:starch phosphorylase